MLMQSIAPLDVCHPEPAHREHGGLPRPGTALSLLGASLTDQRGPLVAAAVDARGCRAQVHCVVMGRGSILQAGGGIHAGQLHCPFSFTVPQHLLQGLSIGFILDDTANDPLYCVLIHVIVVRGLELGVIGLRAPGRAAAVTFLLEHVADHEAHEPHEEEDQHKQEEHVQPMLGWLQVRLWFRHEALGGERGPGRLLGFGGCGGGLVLASAPTPARVPARRGVLVRLRAPDALPALIPRFLPLPPSPPHRLRAAAADTGAAAGGGEGRIERDAAWLGAAVDSG